ncbi:MAG: inorganic phosphate transporter, partial [Polynucleobacter sp.]
MALFKATKDLPKLATDGEAAKELKALVKTFKTSIEFVPLWVVIGTALAMGIGTTVGYKRIVITIAEKIGKTHLTYAQGAMAELVAS